MSEAPQAWNKAVWEHFTVPLLRDWFQRNGGATEMLAHPDVVDAAFTADEVEGMKERGVLRYVETPNGVTCVLSRQGGWPDARDL